MSMLKLKNRVSRNGFDLTRKVAYTAKIGELLPVRTIETLPGDTFKINLSWFTRTQPVNTAAYTRIREYLDVFFVPTNLLWNQFNTFVTQMGNNSQQADSITSAVTVSDVQPYFTLDDIETYINKQMTVGSASGTDSMAKDICGQLRVTQTQKLLDYLDYGLYTGNTGLANINQLGQTALNPFPLLAYQKIYADFYRHQQWENSDPSCFNLNYIGRTGSESMHIPVSSLDGTTDDMFTLRYANWKRDYFMGLLPSSQYGDVAVVGSSSSISQNIQAPIYMVDNNNINPPSSGTLGIFPGSSLSSSGSSKPAGTPIEANSVVLVDGSTNLITPHAGSVYADVDLSAANSAISILAIRKAEAAQKWAEITQSNQQDYMHQVEAHWDTDMSPAYSEHVSYLGGTSSTMDIAEVVNTNLNTTDDSISAASASISGKGVGSGSGTIKFKSPCHGILMVIYHAVPELDYAVNGIAPLNLKNAPTDYAIPEFDRTGMIPIPFIQLVYPASSTAGSYYPEKAIGYGPQYQDYKTTYDTIKGAFVYGGLNSWVAPMTSQYFSDNFGQNFDVTYSLFKVNPSILDTIFAVNAVPTYDGVEGTVNDGTFGQATYQALLGTDQLLVDLSVGCNAVRALDRNGLPY